MNRLREWWHYGRHGHPSPQRIAAEGHELCASTRLVIEQRFADGTTGPLMLRTSLLGLAWGAESGSVDFGHLPLAPDPEVWRHAIMEAVYDDRDLAQLDRDALPRIGTRIMGAVRDALEAREVAAVIRLEVDAPAEAVQPYTGTEHLGDAEGIALQGTTEDAAAAFPALEVDP